MIDLANIKMVIGLTGPIASGKGLAVQAITEEFPDGEVHSELLSDYIREVVRADGKSLTRDTLREAGNALREEDGPGAWAQRMLNNLDLRGGILLVDSIRNPGEIEVLRKMFGDKLMVMATDAPLEDRIERVISRAKRHYREEDDVDISEIEHQMRIEMEDNPETGFAIERCRELADVVSHGKESKQERMQEIQMAVRRFERILENQELVHESRKGENPLRRVA
jgi:dephospho-CoA kinase